MALTPRWTILNHHDQQQQLWTDPHRFKVVVAGRRSGKTELAKRKLVKAALSCTRNKGKFIAGAPTFAQAKRIYWEDLQDLVPKHFKLRTNKTELEMTLINGARLGVVGFDKPVRAEGDPIDGIVLDEYADMKATVWSQTVRPGIATLGRPGWCWFIGKPRGRNHFYNLFQDAPGRDDWARYHWSAEDILPAAEIAALKDELPEMDYDQEIRANFVNFSGRVYYAFGEENAVNDLAQCYNPNLPLDISIDFNVAPGTAAFTQQLRYKDVCKQLGIEMRPNVDEYVDCGIAEIWVPQNSNTEIVANEIVERYKSHRGEVRLFGDASGGARHTSATRGSDWDIIKDICKPHFPSGRLKLKIHKRNPSVKERVNCMNARFRSTSGTIRFLIDPSECVHRIHDFEGVTWLPGTSNEIDKKSAPDLTHLSDGEGYRAQYLYPLKSRELGRYAI